MPTTRHTQLRSASRRATRGAVLVAGLACVLAACGGNATNSSPPPAPEGHDERVEPSRRPTVEIAFPRESYRPGQIARLRVYSPASGVTLQVFHAATLAGRLGDKDVMSGRAVTRPVRLRSVRAGDTIAVRIRNWTSGLYYARLAARPGRVGYAPFVLRPRRLGLHRVAVVLPTQTWQAYNFRDDDGDRTSDTWYASGSTARLGRPFQNRGVPPHYKQYDHPFLRWALATGHRADYLADADLDAVGSGRTLRRAYELLIFPGHHEYVTTREYDAVTRFRDLGGNLAFLSANNFFWRIVKRGNLMIRTRKWRDIGRPEASLIGVQYFRNDSGGHRGPWIVRATSAAPWLFAATKLAVGSSFSSGGIEADRRTPASPPQTRVVAEIPNLYGPGLTAQMTYYERRGAKVFAAGAFSLAAGCRNPVVQQVVGNLWDHLSRP